MAVRGSESKTRLVEQILAAFPNAFIAADGKTIRFSMKENGEDIEIAAAITAKKDVERPTNIDNITAIPNESKKSVEAPTSTPTEEEQERLKKLMAAIGL